MTLRMAPGTAWQRLQRISATLAIAIGGLALVGWVGGSERLKTVAIGLIPMAPSTAVLFILFGGLCVGETLWGSERGSRPRLGMALGLAGTAAAAALLVVSLMGISPPIEHLGMDITGEVGGAPMGHMSPLTAIGFVLTGGAWILMAGGVRRGRGLLALGVSLVVETFGAFLVIAYVVGRPAFYDTGTIPPALNTSLGFMLLGVSLVGAAIRRIRIGAAREGAAPEPPIRLTILAMLCTVLVVTPVYLAFEQHREGLLNEVRAHVLAIADLQTARVESWRSDLERANGIAFGQALFADLLQRALAGEDEAGAALESWLESVRSAHRFARISVFDASGNRYAAVPESGLLSAESGSDTRAVLGDLERDDEGVYVNVITPVFARDGEPLGQVVTRVDPRIDLYATLKGWPTPSTTGETLLVRRDGDDVLFLNDLRFAEDAALRLRLPLGRADLPAAKALRGREGVVEGIDYRGQPVVAAVRAIAGTNWSLVARIDKREAYAPLKRRLEWTLGLIGALVLGVVSAFVLIWQRREALHFVRLTSAEGRYRTLLHSIGDAVIATDAEGKVELMNGVAESLTGWPAQEAVGRPLDEVFVIVEETTRKPVVSPVSRVLDSGRKVALENATVLVARDGGERPIADSAAPVKAPDGSLSGVVLIFRDQSRERKARRELALREERYRSLFNGIRDAIVVADTDRRILDCNPAFTDLFGYAREEIVGRLSSELYESKEEYRSVGEKLRAITGDHQFTATVSYRKKSGEVFSGERGAFLLRDDRGRTVGFVAIIRDVSDREVSQRALESSERRFRELYEAAPVGIFRTDSRGGALAVNRAMARMLDFDSPAEAIAHYGDLAQQLYKDPARRQELLEILHDKGFVDQFEYQAVTAGGRNVWLQMSGRVAELREDGSFELEGFVTDVSERKRAEREREELQNQLSHARRMESVGRLAGGVAHDFNNSIGVILGFAELALGQVQPGSSLAEDLTMMRDAATRSAELTRQLLTFARRQVVQPRQLDLNETVEKLLKMLGRLIGEDIELVWEPAASAAPLEIDPVQIDQVLANLVLNARDAIEGVGRVVIRTDVVRLDREVGKDASDPAARDFVLLEVEDDGRGMDEATRERAFEPFFTTKRVGAGTGLGLSTVFGIVEQNGGFVRLESEVGRGSKFQLFFPRAAEAAEAQPATGSAETPRGSETILVVEDEPAILDLAEKILRELGYEVLPAPGPTEALELVRQHAGAIDLVLTDAVMPQMSGPDMVEQMLRDHPDLRVLFMSGYHADLGSGLPMLPEDARLLQKPFTVERLAAEVRETLDTR